MGTSRDRRVSSTSLIIGSVASLSLLLLLSIGVLFFSNDVDRPVNGSRSETVRNREQSQDKSNFVIAVPRFTVVGKEDHSRAYSRQITSVFREKLSVSDLTITVPSIPPDALRDLVNTRSRRIGPDIGENRELARADYVLVGQFVLPNMREGSEAKVELSLVDGSEYKVLDTVSGSTSFGSLDKFSRKLVGRLFSNTASGVRSFAPAVRSKANASDGTDSARDSKDLAANIPFESCQFQGVTSSQWEKKYSEGEALATRCSRPVDGAGKVKPGGVQKISSLKNISTSRNNFETETREKKVPLPPPELNSRGQEVDPGADENTSESGYPYTPEVQAEWKDNKGESNSDKSRRKRAENTAGARERKEVKRVAASFGDFFWPFGGSRESSGSREETSAGLGEFEQSEAEEDTSETVPESQGPFSGRGDRGPVSEESASAAESGAGSGEDFFWDEGSGSLLKGSQDLEVLEEDPYEIYIDEQRIENEQKINTILRHIAHEEFDKARTAINELPENIRRHPAFKHLIDQLESILKLQQQVGDTLSLEGGRELGSATGLDSRTQGSDIGASSNY